jgi:hypothetical protein
MTPRAVGKKDSKLELLTLEGGSECFTTVLPQLAKLFESKFGQCSFLSRVKKW